MAVASLLTTNISIASNEPTLLKIYPKDDRQSVVNIPLSGLPVITFGSGVINVSPSKGGEVSTFLCDEIKGIVAAQGEIIEYVPVSESTGGRQSVNVSPDPKPERPVPVEPVNTYVTEAIVTLKNGEYFYEGKAIEAEISSVTCDGVTLQKDVHYSVTFSNNINAGQADVIITGIGDYSGSKTIHFTILPETMTAAVITLANDSYSYTGSAVMPELTVKHGATELVNGTDYSVEYYNNVAPGTATVTVTGKGNYTGTTSTQFQIVRNVDFAVAINNNQVANPTGNDNTWVYSAERGTVYLTGVNGVEGDTLTIVARPNDGYELKPVNVHCMHIVSGSSTTSVDTSKTSVTDGIYTTKIIMPSSGSIILMVDFMEVNGVAGIESVDEGTVYVYDARGVLVATIRKQEGEKIEEVLSPLADGLYIIKVNNKTYKIYKR